MLMENNKTAVEKFMGGKVVELVSFLADRVTKKNTTYSSKSKFKCGMHFNSICKITENLKMRVSRDLALKSFKRGFIRKKWCG
jgi:hypothetical protein